MIRSQNTERFIGPQAANGKKAPVAAACGRGSCVKGSAGATHFVNEGMAVRDAFFGTLTASRNASDAYRVCRGPLCRMTDHDRHGDLAAAMRIIEYLGGPVRSQVKPTSRQAERETEARLTMCRNTTAQSVGQTVGSRAGFTLIELLIVIVILAISAAIAVPMMSSAASMQIRAAGGIVAADLEYAKSMAISRGQNHSVVFDPANERYEIQDQSGTVIKHPITQKENGYIVDFANDGRLDRVKINSTTFTGNTVTFDPLGSPTDNGGQVVLQAGDSTRTVTVEPVTGFISVSE